MAKHLLAVPISLKEANDFVLSFHRHSKPVKRAKFSIGAGSEDGLVGVAIVGQPVARLLANGYTAEVRRTCVRPGAPKGTNSFLYARCWQAARAMGYRKLVTYTLASESGASLRGAGWKVVAECDPRDTNWGRGNPDATRYREWQPIYGQLKLRWEIA